MGKRVGAPPQPPGGRGPPLRHCSLGSRSKHNDRMETEKGGKEPKRGRKTQSLSKLKDTPGLCKTLSMRLHAVAAPVPH